MTLEPEEKVAGRLFRDRAQTDLDEFVAVTKPDFDPPWFLASYRHLCEAKYGTSTTLELREIYVTSPRIVVETNDSGVHSAQFFDEWVRVGEQDSWIVPAGRFGFVYRNGRCAACGSRGVSTHGHFVDAWQRPPVQAARGYR